MRFPQAGAPPLLRELPRHAEPQSLRTPSRPAGHRDPTHRTRPAPSCAGRPHPRRADWLKLSGARLGALKRPARGPTRPEVVLLDVS